MRKLLDPDRAGTAVVLEDGPVSWASLAASDAARDAACEASARETGARVGIHEDNSAGLVVRLLALLDGGAVPVLAHPRWPKGMASEAFAAAGVGRPLPGAATVLFTSGSTGAPKAVVHSLTAHLASATGSGARTPFGPGDRWLLSLPLCHVGGLSLLFRAVVGGGALAVPDPDVGLVDAIERLRPTHLSLVATQLRRLVLEPRGRRALAGVRELLLGGGPVDDELLRQAMEHGVPVRQTYGSTEMASQICTSGPGSPWSCGQPLDQVEVKVDEEGEILVRGPSMCSGYLEGDNVSSVLQDGWLRTGDLGAFDGAGLSVRGRRDNRFISGGENVQPEAIERAMAAAGHEVVVVPVDDADFGARPVAFVRGSIAGLDEIARAVLPGYMRPVAWLPWTDERGGKPQRAELRSEAARRVR